MLDWAKRDERKARRRTQLRRVRNVIAVSIATTLVGGTVILGLMTWHGREAWSMDLAPLEAYRPALTMRVLARDGSVLAELPASVREGGVAVSQRRTLVALRDIPPSVPAAFMAAEDADFFDHEGLDYRGMLRAAWVNLRTGRLAQGASTITQQTIKNVLFHNERSFSRKSQELILAGRVEHSLGKERILEIYLNEIYFGCGRYGVEEAAQHYFGLSARDLDLGQAAVLAGLPKAPSQLNPHKAPHGALKRQHYVLEQMLAHGWATGDEVRNAMEQPPAFRDHDADLRQEATRAREYGEIITMARRAAARRMSAEQLASSGVELRTTIDPARQQMARAALVAGLDRLERRHGYGKHARTALPGELQGLLAPDRPRPSLEERALAVVRSVLVDVNGQTALELRIGANRVLVLDPIPGAALDDLRKRFMTDGVLEIRLLAHNERDPFDLSSPQSTVSLAQLTPGPQGAVVVMELDSNDVLAWIGGRDRSTSELDRARQAVREVGSTIKPLIASVGLEEGTLTAASLLRGSDNVLMTLRRGLARSDNQVARAMVEKIGFARLDERIPEFGLDSALPHDSTLAMGNVAMSPAQLVAAYARFARGGEAVDMRVIDSMVSWDGTCWSCEGSPSQPEQDAKARSRRDPRSGAMQRDIHGDLPALPPMNRSSAHLMTSLLRSVVEEGTANALAEPELRAISGKTGTTDEAHDVWFVGYTRAHVAVVWVGFDQPRSLGEGESGGRTALPIWRDALDGLLEPSSQTGDGGVDALDQEEQEDLDTPSLATTAGLGLSWVSDRSGTPPCREAHARFRPAQCDGFFFVTCQPAGEVPTTPYWRCEDPSVWRLERFMPGTGASSLEDVEAQADLDRVMSMSNMTLAQTVGSQPREAQLRLVTFELFEHRLGDLSTHEQQIAWIRELESWTSATTQRVEQALGEGGLLYPGALAVGERFSVRFGASGDVVLIRLHRNRQPDGLDPSFDAVLRKEEALRNAVGRVHTPLSRAGSDILHKGTATTELTFERLPPLDSGSGRRHD